MSPAPWYSGVNPRESELDRSRHLEAARIEERPRESVTGVVDSRLDVVSGLVVGHVEHLAPQQDVEAFADREVLGVAEIELVVGVGIAGARPARRSGW